MSGKYRAAAGAATLPHQQLSTLQAVAQKKAKESALLVADEIARLSQKVAALKTENEMLRRANERLIEADAWRSPDDPPSVMTTDPLTIARHPKGHEPTDEDLIRAFECFPAIYAGRTDDCVRLSLKQLELLLAMARRGLRRSR